MKAAFPADNPNSAQSSRNSSDQTLQTTTKKEPAQLDELFSHLHKSTVGGKTAVHQIHKSSAQQKTVCVCVMIFCRVNQRSYVNKQTSAINSGPEKKPQFSRLFRVDNSMWPTRKQTLRIRVVDVETGQPQTELLGKSALFQLWQTNKKATQKGNKYSYKFVNCCNERVSGVFLWNWSSAQVYTRSRWSECPVSWMMMLTGKNISVPLAGRLSLMGEAFLRGNTSRIVFLVEFLKINKRTYCKLVSWKSLF